MGRFIPNRSLLPKLAISPQMAAAMLAGAEAVAEEARRTAPVLSGSYRNSIQVESTVENGQVTGRVFADDMAAGFIEFGTIDTPTFAPLRRAAEMVFGVGKLRG